MDKEKLSRKRSSTDARDTFPSPPPSPQLRTRSSSVVQVFPDAFKRLLEYKTRETDFLKTLNETIAMDCKKIKSESIEESSQAADRKSGEIMIASSQGSEDLSRSDCELLRDECENFLMPLLHRTGPSISAALVTYDAFEQLNKLHGLLDQLLQVQNQTYQMQRQIRDVTTLCELKKLQKKDSTEVSNEAELSDNELDLNTILAAGNSASTKRSTAKRQRERSKSVIAEDIQMFAAEKEKTSSLRRQSAFTDSKSKVSKWTKVKAAFKWERANVAAMNEGKSLDSGISIGPMNHEVARYLRVPSVPCTGSSADSVLSSSSGHLLSGGSVPATPGTISSASSIEDVGGASEEIRNNRDSSKSDSRCESRAHDDDSRRSRSLDGDAIIGQSLTREGKNKTPWRKVKDIIQTHRGSFKGKSRSRSVKSSGTCSREHSPCESIDALSNVEDRHNDYSSSNPASPVQKSMPSLSVSHDSGSYSYSPNGSTSGLHHRDDSDGKSIKSFSKGSRKSKILPDFEVLPEDVIVDVKSCFQHGKPPPSPLNLRQDFSDAEYGDLSYSPTFFGKSSSKFFRPRKALASGNSSVPSSPSRHSEFFGEFDPNLHSEDFSSGDFSEPSSPHHHKLSPKSSLLMQQKEINEKYMELCEQLSKEFEAKREEWKKIQAACAASTSTAYQMMSKDEGSISSKNVPVTLLEENLTPDFKKKLHKWRVKKQCSVTNVKDPQISPTKENEQKKIDWNLWKTGQLKLEGQGLTPMPGQKDLPENFQKKLEQWRKLKESNTVPPYNSQDSLKRSKKSKDDSDKYDRDKMRPDREKLKSNERDKLEKLSKLKAMVTDLAAKEIEVQTSKGILKFEGISRKFTRKLYEWEKARGIGPESSTFALLHPGYRPLDVGNGSQDNAPQESSPVLGRSLSLDSISPNPSVPSISHQPSSLSLNDMKESNSIEDGLEETGNSEFSSKVDDQQEEPEAVIVEVEDDIVETAAPLFTAHPIIARQTPVYKYEIPCTELCSGKTAAVLCEGGSTQPKTLSTQALQNVSNLRRLQSQQDNDYKKNLKHVQKVLTSLKDSLPDLERCMRGSQDSSQGYRTLSIVKKCANEIMEMLESLSLAETFDEDELSKRTAAIDIKLSNLQKSINLVCKYIETRKLNESIPEINIISDEIIERGRAIVSTTPKVFHSEVVVNQPIVLVDTLSLIEASSPIDPIRLDPGEGSSRKINRTVSNGSKKKMRLRKMGSRQNSKTESDSDEESLNIVLEAPRRVKRKTSKAKKPPEEERKQPADDKKEDSYGGEDIVYVLKVKPGHKIEQETKADPLERNVLISPTEHCVELLEAAPEAATSSANIFVKTKRKVFTTVDEPSGGVSKVAVVKDIESSSASERTDKDNSSYENEKSETILKTLPPIPQSPSFLRRLDVKTSNMKEPSPSIRLMIARYNQKVEKSTKSPMNSGSCSPVAVRSPVLERRVKTQTEKYQRNAEKVMKSASAGNIRGNGLVAVNISDIDFHPANFKLLSKASSAEVLSSNWQGKLPSVQSNYFHNNDDIFSPSLACDSLKAISKTRNISVNLPESNEKEKKEHLFKKNKEKPTSLFGKTGAVKKIGLKSGRTAENIWRRSISSTPSETWSLPDKSDNTMPKITRKYENVMDIVSNSAPTTPMDDMEKPKTPLSERAMKLQRAKDEFLKGNVQRCSTWDSATNKEDTWKKRLSGSSFESVTSNEPSECSLLKSASVGFFDISPDDDIQHIEGYVTSLPRIPSRTEKSSKFGFSSIASKFRKVKMRRGSKDVPKYNAVSALCRQSLAVVDIRPDVIALQENLKKAEDEKKVFKSCSSHGMGFWSGFRKLDKLVKSKSANLLPQNDNDDEETQ